jgi:hypothetical protein
MTRTIVAATFVVLAVLHSVWRERVCFGLAAAGQP